MDKRSTSGRDAQAQRMAMKRQSARMLMEAMVGADGSLPTRFFCGLIRLSGTCVRLGDSLY